MLLKISALEKTTHNRKKPTHFPQQKAYLNLNLSTNMPVKKHMFSYEMSGCSEPAYSKISINVGSNGIETGMS